MIEGEALAILSELWALRKRVPAAGLVIEMHFEALALPLLEPVGIDLDSLAELIDLCAGLAATDGSPKGLMAADELWRLAARARSAADLARTDDAMAPVAHIRARLGGTTARDAVTLYRSGTDDERGHAADVLLHLLKHNPDAFLREARGLVADLLAGRRSGGRPIESRYTVEIVAAALGSGMEVADACALAEAMGCGKAESVERAFRRARKARAGEVATWTEAGRKMPGWGERELRLLGLKPTPSTRH